MILSWRSTESGKAIPCFALPHHNSTHGVINRVECRDQMSEEWQKSFQEEIERALQARAKGNEGRARVCARRALKHIIAEYLRRKNIHANTQSAYGLIRFLTTLTLLPK